MCVCICVLCSCDEKVGSKAPLLQLGQENRKGWPPEQTFDRREAAEQQGGPWLSVHASHQQYTYARTHTSTYHGEERRHARGQRVGDEVGEQLLVRGARGLLHPGGQVDRV